jgi:hypothetical protein
MTARATAIRIKKKPSADISNDFENNPTITTNIPVGVHPNTAYSIGFFALVWNLSPRAKNLNLFIPLRFLGNSSRFDCYFLGSFLQMII